MKLKFQTLLPVYLTCLFRLAYSDVPKKICVPNLIPQSHKVTIGSAKFEIDKVGSHV